jgi:O-antigen/teichoic acid export membrane protein
LLDLVGGRLRSLGRDDLIRHGALVFVSISVVNLLSFAFHMLVSRRLGVDAYGSLNALLAGFTVLYVPAAILTTVVAKYAAEFRAVGDTARLRALALRIAVWLSAAALAIFVLGALAAPAIATYLHVADARSVVLTAAILAVNLVLPVLRGVLQGVENFRAFAVSAILEAAVKVGLAFALTGAGFGVNGALAAWLLGSVASLVWTGAILAIEYGRAAAAPLRLDVARLLRTTGGVALATLCVASLGFSDVVIVKHVFDARTAGLYGATSLAGKMLYWLVSFVPIVVLPRAVSRVATGASARPILLQALGIVAVLAGAGLAAYALFPGAIVRALAGGAFGDAAPLLLPYGVATTLLAVLNTVVIYKIGVHRFGFVIPLALVALAELIAIATFHDTPYRVISILIVADAVALAVTLVAAPERRPSPGGVPAAS